MRDTAEALEDTEAMLHRSAEASPDKSARDRLHRLGDQVTARAEDIVARADRLSSAERPRPSV
jgi:ElaB/YqjD/DUF883 family membrane-anchored ribosome-binding protein